MKTLTSILFLVFISLFFSINSHSQELCGGNLGENIFTEGDFGSGVSNIVSNNPGIAPGYNYDFIVPPDDGDYVITNNTNQWANLYQTWLRIPDNSDDPNGYMMVINASFSPGLFYDQTVSGLCENTLYEFSADIINMIRNGVTDHLKPNVSFLINNQVVLETGEIPQDEQWHTFGSTFTTAPGQTSVQLSLRNNAPGGNGNDLALDNIRFRACGPEAFILPEEPTNICEDGDPITLAVQLIGAPFNTPAFQWQESFDQGITWSDIPNANAAIYTHNNLTSGFYYYRFKLASGASNLQNNNCTIISSIKIIQVVPKFYSTIDTLCEGIGYEQGNNIYNSSGIYIDSLISSIGCDSIVTLDLTIIDNDLSVSYTTTDESCPDVNDGSIGIDMIINGTEPISFLMNDSIPPPFDFLSPDNYTILATDRYRCSFEQQITINGANDELILDLGTDQSVTLGEAVDLNVFTNFTPNNIQWSPEGLIDCSMMDCLSPTLFPTEDIQLTITASTNEACSVSDSISITVDELRLVYIPNAFSPNDDGHNDHFTVFASEPNVQLIRRLTVFNRWGGVMFDGTDFAPNVLTNGWDGRTKGKTADIGIYTYLVEVLFLDGVIKNYSGDVLLLK